ncbi:hypothetical protein [Pectobacterium aquaticum]|uniref:Uncharacterized protein n=1 Tax=Pectobacterium aquaticum TaxID=2204145 RepID=A0AA93DMG2_9GAMM|nr:hypothetical protein [Pectobacterium aquaticum]RRO07096.1 hypothetical protein DMB85_013990 [Pectobacterium aquaticum]RRO22462.1 hypothetical protein DMB84_006135 [Pectobacterium aquaticum]
MYHYESETYIEVSRKFMEACAWLDSLGIEYSRTRVGSYGKIFGALAKCQQAGTLETFYNEHSFESWVNAAHEVAEIIRIYEGLGEQSVPSLNVRLKNAIKGQELYVLDSENRSGRDFSFELSTAAKFVSAGLTVDFGHDADLKVKIDDFTLFVECKRLKSTKKIQKRIKEGLKQLHKRYVESEQPSNARGLLALSIGKTINATLGLLEGSNYKDLGNKAASHNRAFGEKYKSYWQEKSDRRTLGVAIFLDTPGIITPEKQLVTCHEVTINNSSPANTPENMLLNKIFYHVFQKRT